MHITFKNIFHIVNIFIYNINIGVNIACVRATDPGAQKQSYAAQVYL